MIISYTSLFHRSFNGLTETQQEQITEAITRFMQRTRPPHPKGWRVHKLESIKGTPEKEGDTPPDVWEMHAPGPGALVVTFQYGQNEITFRNCGLHDKTIKNA